MQIIMGVSLLFALMAMPGKAQKWEHLADTPQMGWSTWNKFQGNINEDIIRGIADAMVETGLRDAGYVARCRRLYTGGREEVSQRHEGSGRLCA